MPKSAIIIGAGLGGIAAAGRLSRMGYQVNVFEKGALPGGRVALIQRDGYRFDTGPTLFLMPEVFADTFTALGEKMEDHLDLLQLDPTYRVHFNDGSRLDLTSNLVEMREQLDALEPGSFAAYLKFLSDGYRNYNLSLKKFVGRNFYSIYEYFSLENLPLLIQLKALVKHADYTARRFRDPRLQAAFSFQNMYLGLSPYDAPATFTLLQYTELANGVWFPRGGMYKTVEAFVSIAEGLGVRFFYNTAVKKIEVEEKRAIGVALENGEIVRADLIIANADLPYVYSDLLPQDGSFQRLNKKKFTSSALMFYWGVRGKRSHELLHHNVFLADHRYKESFDSIFNDLTLPEEPSFYLNVPSRTDDSFARPDGDGIMALVPVGHLNEAHSQDWSLLEEKARQAVFARLNRLGIGEVSTRLIFEEKIGPNDYKNILNLTKGSAFGLSHNFMQVGFFRPHNKHPRYKNLYFVGASTHPGTGLPIVLLSARLVAERIEKEQIGSKRVPLPVSGVIMEK